MIASRDEYFREWLRTFPEELFVILRVYADESFTDKALTLCGFMESPEYWDRFSNRWKAVLRKHAAPYFHFREFADKKNRWKIPGNPYLDWSEKDRDDFLNDLAIVLCESAVPLGGIFDIETFRSKAMEGDPMELLIAQLYVNFSDQLNAHWPGFRGQVLFVFDETENEGWIETLNTVHKKAQKVEARIGGLSFENDRRCPPLQGADFFAYISRQNTEKYYEQGRTKQVKRTLDWILTRNVSPTFKKQFTYAGWLRLVRLILADRKRKKAIWAKQGQPKRPYYPELDFKPEEHGTRYRRMDTDFYDRK